MSITKKLTGAAFAALLALTLAGAASAQDNSTTAGQDKTQKQERGERRFGRGEGRGMHEGHRGGGFGMFRDLNLTDAQKEQIHTILEKNKPDQAVMEELRSLREAGRAGTLTDTQKARAQQLREQNQANRKAVHEQLLAVLTAEQRQQLEARKANMEKRREEFRQRRQQQKPVDKPTNN